MAHPPSKDINFPPGYSFPVSTLAKWQVIAKSGDISVSSAAAESKGESLNKGGIS
jgi:hypothetical protein